MKKNNKNIWISTSLFYANSLDFFLCKAIKPFIYQVFKNSYAKHFFFIRYWEGGAHIRLRFKGDPEILKFRLKPFINEYFESFFHKNPSVRSSNTTLFTGKLSPNDSIVHSAYEPEIERYGGFKGILIAEKHFEASSITVLSTLENENFSDHSISLSIQMNLLLSYFLELSYDEIISLFSYVHSTWFNSVFIHNAKNQKTDLNNAADEVLLTFEKNFVKLKPALVSKCVLLKEAVDKKILFQEEWVNNWIRHLIQLNKRLKILLNKDGLRAPPFQSYIFNNVSERKKILFFILQSYIHMTNNRLGIKNGDEPYIAYLIKRSVESLKNY